MANSKPTELLYIPINFSLSITRKLILSCVSKISVFSPNKINQWTKIPISNLPAL